MRLGSSGCSQKAEWVYCDACAHTHTQFDLQEQMSDKLKEKPTVSSYGVEPLQATRSFNAP